jgi:enamine deaminase RidA (YjgF/YER057c/UK114 family)
MIKRLGAGKRLSMATIHGGLVYLAGQVPDDLSVGIEAQAAQVLAKIDTLLTEAGTDKSSILTATVWLPNIADFAAFNTVWDAWPRARRRRGPVSKQDWLTRPFGLRSRQSRRFLKDDACAEGG